MSRKQCGVPGCGNPRKAKGYCNRHYRRWRLYGNPLAPRKIRPMTDRFWEKVDRRGPDECWLWKGGIGGRGYGVITVDGVPRKAHHIAYELEHGKGVPRGKEIDHLCHNRDQACRGGESCIHRRCVNPRHLEPVTHQTNAQRGRTGAHNTTKTYCPRGHPYSGANLYIDLQSGSRRCRECIAIANKQWWENGGREKRAMKPRPSRAKARPR